LFYFFEDIKKMVAGANPDFSAAAVTADSIH